MKEQKPRLREMLFVDCSKLFKLGRNAGGMGEAKLDEKKFHNIYPDVRKLYPRREDRDQLYQAYCEGFERSQYGGG